MRDVIIRNEPMASRNVGIDFLRGIAILLVVIHHIAIRIPLIHTDAALILPGFLLRALSWNGQKAVTLFFVISGFLITSTTVSRWGGLDRVSFTRFAGHRAFRILPCLLVLLALLATLNLLHAHNFVFHHEGQSLPMALFAALSMWLNLYEVQTGYLPANWDVLWSLSIEESFYLFFPLLCILLGRWRGMLIASFAVLALSMPLEEWWLRNASEIWREKAYGPGFSAIATGVCAALAGRSGWFDGRANVIRWLGRAGSVGVAAILANDHFFHAYLGVMALPLFTLACAMLILAFHAGWGRGRTDRYLGWAGPWGRMSYEIYLSHMFVVLPAIDLFIHLGSPMRWGWIWFIAVAGIAFVLGVAVTECLSRPANRWLSGRFGLHFQNQVRENSPFSAQGSATG